MPDQPTDNKSDSYVPIFLDVVASPFVIAAVQALISGRPWYVWTGYAAAGLSIGLLGFYWVRIRQRTRARLMLAIDRVAASQRFRRGCVMVALVLIGSYLIIYLHSLRSDLDTYVMPRVVTDRQARDLRDYLSHHEAHALTVKVNPLDEEAMAYAGQLFNAFHNANWDVKLDTSNGDPNTSNSGLCTSLTGWNSGPPDPKHDPVPLLQDALLNAHIATTCGGGIGAGEYRVFLLVGRRPLMLGDHRPMLAKIGRWIERLGQQR
jgi:hypothetical protein